MNFSILKFLAKKVIKTDGNFFCVLKISINNTILTNFNYFSKLTKIPETVNRIWENCSHIHKITNRDNSLQNSKLQKLFLISYFTLVLLFNGTPNNKVLKSFLRMQVKRNNKIKQRWQQNLPISKT